MPPSFVRQASHRPEKIISGGQTGVDRGALDAAIELGIPHGGWCPRGRLAEDGTIPARYALKETRSSTYAVRTERNVMDADATLILYRGVLQGGTALTHQLARKHGKPYFLIDLERLPEALPDALQPPPEELAALVQWLDTHRFRTLNIAGPRESQQPEITGQAIRLIRWLFARDA